MHTPIFTIQTGDSPVIAAAIHDGFCIREELQEYLALDADGRRREEDPHTALWTQITDNRIVGLQSRFELDLNRPPEKAIYRTPEDAWGLTVWNTDLPDDVAQRSLASYYAFYDEVKRMLTTIVEKHGSFIVYDLHTYNHLRGGADGPAADPEANPEVNIGTGNMNRRLWAPVVDQFMNDLRAYDFMGRNLDVRENVKFEGGYFSHWIHDNFPDVSCVLAIEFKKFFMNEWTGEVDTGQLEAIHHALKATIPGVLQAREQVSLKTYQK